MLPHWNYAKLWNEDCLIDNKWLPADEEIKLDKEGCKYCSNIVKHNNNTIDRVQNLNKKGMSKDYISLTQPVVILDGMKDWNSLPLDMDVLSKVCFKTFLNTINGMMDLHPAKPVGIFF